MVETMFALVLAAIASVIGLVGCMCHAIRHYRKGENFFGEPLDTAEKTPKKKVICNMIEDAITFAASLSLCFLSVGSITVLLITNMIIANFGTKEVVLYAPVSELYENEDYNTLYSAYQKGGPRSPSHLNLLYDDVDTEYIMEYHYTLGGIYTLKESVLVVPKGNTSGQTEGNKVNLNYS